MEREFRQLTELRLYGGERSPQENSYPSYGIF